MKVQVIKVKSRKNLGQHISEIRNMSNTHAFINSVC